MTARGWTKDERRGLAEASNAVSRRLDEWDPLLVYDDPENAPAPGEYDDLVWPLVRLLLDGASVERVAGFLADAVEGYGLDRPTPPVSFAGSLTEWWATEHG